MLIAADRETRIQEWRHSVLVKIGKFRQLQKVYMPGAARAMSEAEQERDTDAVPPKAEKVKLFMPSAMVARDENDTLRGCVAGLIGMETKLRVAQCSNSLAKLRARLHAKRHIIGFRNDNTSGQVQATKARSLIGEVGERVQAFAQRYRTGRAAIVALTGDGEYPAFRELKDDDIRLDGDSGETDANARKKLGMIGSGRGERTPRNGPGTSRRIMSWIWTAPGALDDEEQQIHECECNRNSVAEMLILISCPRRVGARVRAQSQMDGGSLAVEGGDA